jgi:hypothetical protein
MSLPEELQLDDTGYDADSEEEEDKPRQVYRTEEQELLLQIENLSLLGNSSKTIFELLQEMKQKVKF